MKLNQDCVRDILLSVENTPMNYSILVTNLIDESDDFLRNNDVPKYDTETVIYAAAKLVENSYLKGKVISSDQQPIIDVKINSLTWDGHEFLNTIRDPKVWKKTKNTLATFQSVSLKTMGTVATKILSDLVSKQLGL